MTTQGIIILLFFLTLIISFLGSISGVGGGVLYVPLLVLLLGSVKSNEEIKLISTFLVFASALFNVILEFFKKNINPVIILVSIVFATPSVFLGNWLIDLISESGKDWIMQVIIIVFLTIVSMFLILTEYVFKNKSKSNVKEVKQNKKLIYIKLSKSNPKQINILIVCTVAFFAGLITSLTGMGGGPIIMPILIMFCYLNMRESAPISHTIIMVSSLISIILSAFNHQFTSNTSLYYLLPLSFAAIGSTVASFYLKKYIKKDIYIKWVLIVLIWASIIKMVVDLIS